MLLQPLSMRFRPHPAGWHPTVLVLVLAAWLATVGNLPLWHALWTLHQDHAIGLFPAVTSCAAVLTGLLAGTLCLLVWPPWRRPLGVLLMLISALASYFMLAYGVVIDPSMMVNVAHTDPREVRDLLSASMGMVVLAGVVLPGVWWWRQPVRRLPARRLAWQQTGVGALALLIGVTALWSGFQETAALMREHKALRYTVTPFNVLYGGLRLGVGASAHAHVPRQIVGADAHVGTRVADAAPLVVLVIGETARAENFGLSGYRRDTTPGLSQLAAAGRLSYFPHVQSCGTNTHTSLPCLFSHLGHAGVGREAEYDNLLDVLQRAGLTVIWLDNQSGCKGVCARVTSISTRVGDDPVLCPDGECHDEIMLAELPQALARLDPARAARGTVVVLHQMGSHGPAYHRRSPPDAKAFLPECTESTLQDCPADTIVNAYDNSIRYTDRLLRRTIDWLAAQSRPTAMLYVSDHGESLGEGGLYLHGMPRALAPTQQTHVPMLAWASDTYLQQRGWSTACMNARASDAFTHDSVFHAMLNLAGVHTRLYQPALDPLQRCG